MSLSADDRRELERLKAAVARLERTGLSGPGVGSNLDTRTVRTTQLGFAAELTGAYESTGTGKGYPWKRLLLDTTVPGFTNPGVQPTGDLAFAPDGDTSLKSGTRVWLEPSPDASGYVIAKPGTRQVTKGKLDGSLSAGGSATLSVWEWNGSAEADTGENLTLYDWNLPAGTTIVAGTAVEAIQVAGRWYVIPPAGLSVDKGVLAGVLNQGSSATVRLWHVVSGTETDTGIDVTAFDWCLGSGDSIASGKHVFVRNVAGRWYVDQAA